ncbi:MAG: TIM barrel protein [Candidatus Hydrogenedentota bacterium]
MRFGFCIHFGLKDIIKAIKKAKRLGFNYVDITIDHPTMMEVDVREIKRLLKDYEMEIGIQTPWETIFLASSWEECIRGNLEVIDRCFSFGEKIGSKYLNVHIREDFGNFLNIWNLTEEKKQLMTETLKEIVSRYSNKMIVTAETPGSSIFSVPENFNSIIRESGCDVCIDTGHIWQSTKNNYKKFVHWFNILNDKIKVIHLSGGKKTKTRVAPHYVPNLKQLEIMTDCFKRCKNLNYIMFEFFRGVKPENLHKREIQILKKLRDEIDY